MRENTVSFTDVFRTPDVAVMADVSPRQLQWWDVQKIVSPKQIANRRVYTANEVLCVLLAAELRRKGMSLPTIKHLFARPVFESHIDIDVVESYFLTNGRDIKFENDPAQALNTGCKSALPVYVVSIDAQLEKINAFSNVSPVPFASHSTGRDLARLPGGTC